MDMTDASVPQGRQLDSGPPRPPRNGRSLMSMATDQPDGQDTNSGFDTSSPAIQVMKAMGDARNALLKLSSYLPTLAPGVQQIISGLEQVVPQQVADLVSGTPAGSSGSGLGAANAPAPPPPPQVQTGAP